MVSLFNSSRSRLIGITTVTLTLLFALSTRFWTDAYSIKNQASYVQSVSEQENMLFELALSLSVERASMYEIANSEETVAVRLNEFDLAAQRTDELIRQHMEFVDGTHQHISFFKRIFSHHEHADNETKPHTSARESNAQSSALIGEEAPSNHGNADVSGNAVSHDSSDGHGSAGDHGFHGNHKKSHDTSHVHIPEFDNLFSELSMARESIKQQFLLERSERDSSLSMQYFHLYMNLIDSIGSIRSELRAVPKFSNHSAVASENLKQAIWELSESTSQISALVEGLRMFRGVYDSDEISAHYTTMLIDANFKAERSWMNIQSIHAKNAFSANVREITGTTLDWYKNVYKQSTASLLGAIRNNQIQPADFAGWLSIRSELHRKTEILRKSATDETLANIKALEKQANTNLVFDTALVFLCLIMGIVCTWYFKKVHRQAHQDELTGLDNRRMFTQRISEHLSKTRNDRTDRALLIIDLDRFKYVNDTMGHAVGDKLLQSVSTRLLHTCGNDAEIARLGGDEFAVLAKCSDTQTLKTLAKQISLQLSQPFFIGNAVVHIGSSIGISFYPQDAKSVDSLMNAADLAMYSAKKSGSNIVLEYHSEMVAEFEYRTRTETELRLAIENDEFELFFQPQYSVSSETVDAVEALIRWNHPHRGLVMPDKFIHIAEESGLMPAIGEWVLNEACRQASKWINDEGLAVRVAVNVSPEQFTHPKFVKSITDFLETHALSAKYLEIELTESVVMTDIDYVVESLAELQEVGIHIALDDFGTGYSSLGYLKDLPLDVLKIDKSFVQRLGTGDVKHDSVTSVIAELATFLNLDTVAEGVETEDQIQLVKDIGVSHIQGYYFSKPVAAISVPEIIRQINGEDHHRKAA